jgi:hypothetical protein
MLEGKEKWKETFIQDADRTSDMPHVRQVRSCLSPDLQDAHKMQGLPPPNVLRGTRDALSIEQGQLQINKIMNERFSYSHDLVTSPPSMCARPQGRHRGNPINDLVLDGRRAA